MDTYGASDHDQRAPIEWTRGPPDLINHVCDWRRYNGLDQVSREASGSSDEDPMGAIQGVL